ncbi:hypothetical protein [Pedobacter faecalis]|uniref:hypothetical protein n=1 Tax=Pedobacter faecalis TaxID=3041495 RepID=UPI00254BF525|nr:hypothetical protein [Pedobacter sp. ELA7]
MKKILILILLLLTAIVAMAYFYFSALNADKKNSDGSLYAISQHAALVLCFQNDKSSTDILGDQPILQQVLGSDKYNELKSVGNMLIQSQAAVQAVDKQNIYIGLIPEKKNLTFLYVTQINSESNLTQVISELGGKINLTLEKDRYKLNLSDTLTCYLTLRENLLFLSPSSAVLNQALSRTLEKDNPFGAYIRSTSRISKNSLAEVHINFNQLPAVLKSTMPGNLSGELAVLNHMDAYTSLIYNYSAEKLLLNGSTQVNGRDSYYALYRHEPQKVTITNILPENTANYIVYTILQYGRWREELNKWLTGTSKGKTALDLTAQISEKYHLDLEQTFPRYFTNQLITFQLSTSEKLGAIALSNGEKLGQLLLDLSAEHSDDIRIFKESDLLFSFFGEPFKNFRRPYYTIVDNYLIFANYASTVQVFLNNYRNNRLLINRPNYLAAINQLPNSSSIMFYSDLDNSSRIMLRNIYLPYYKHLRQESMKDFNAFIWQMSGENGKYQTNVLMTKKAPADSLSQNSLALTP